MRVSEMEDPVIMWDASKGLYWRDNACGYTGAAEVAGVYERADAQKYCNGERRIELLKVLEGHVQFLRKALDDARAEAAKLRKDAERLDWIESQYLCVSWLSMSGKWDVLTNEAHPAHRKNYQRKALRAAIDAAIAAQRQKEKA